MNKIFTLLFLILPLAIVACKNSEPADTATEDLTPANISEPAVTKAHDIHANDRLAEKIEQLANSDSTQYAVFVAYPDEHRLPYIYQSKPMRSASMIKVFILATLMEKVRDGQISLDDNLTLLSSAKVGGAGILASYASGSNIRISKIARLMITESDNTATNMLIEQLGMDTINIYMAENGYHDSTLQRKMMDIEAINEGLENYTSVTDLGNFFLKLYRHECISYELDELMLEYLKEQTDTECFPAVLPQATIAHKTGELIGLYDDGGIIYTNDKNIILVIMTENYSTRHHAIHTMQEMAQCVTN